VERVLRQYFDWGVIWDYLPALAKGFWITAQLAFFAELIALTVGLVLRGGGPLGGFPDSPQ
jgi:ABC-type amino acid transport system permease subunit